MYDQNVINLNDYRIEHFKNQRYAKLKKQCLRQRLRTSSACLFEDPTFQPVDTNLYYSKRLPRGLKWMRPHEIAKRKNLQPKFIVNTINYNDLDQGFLGNCWFVAGCTAITFLSDLFKKVVPQWQEFDEANYTGLFHFRFWLYGRWTDVVIDDYLPVWEDGRLAFCSNREEPNEFWAALLEKAYAKVCGSYENMEGGFTSDILIDLTGGLEENFHLVAKTNRKEKDQLWKILTTARNLRSMNGCYIEPDPAVYEAKLANGLVKGHAYTVTNLASLNDNYGRTIRLIRLRNPWANEVEWKGAWSDSSREFLTASEDVKRKLDYRKENEGEFWMSFDEDFYANFDLIQFCHLTPDSLSEEILKSYHNRNISWNLVSYHGEWLSGVSAGGSGNMGDKRYWMNPQYLIRLVDVDLDDNENLATVIIALMQKNTRENRAKNYGHMAEEYIQFRIFKVKNEQIAQEAQLRNLKLDDDLLERVGNSGDYVNKREVTKRFRLEPGYYVIVPSTYEANTNGKFLLRIFTETMINRRQILANNIDSSSKNRWQPQKQQPSSTRFAPNQDLTVKKWINTFSSNNNNNNLDSDTGKVEFTSLAAASNSASFTEYEQKQPQNLEEFKKRDYSAFLIKNNNTNNKTNKSAFFGIFKHHK